MGKAKKNKRPNTRQGFPNLEKTPKASFPIASKIPKADIREYNSLNPSWHISLLETVDPFGWHQIEKDKFIEIKEKLANFETMSWNEILITAKKRNHSIEIYKICKEARDRLEEIGQDDIDSLVSLRLSGKERIWGIRSLAVLKLLWWDPEHKICSSLPD